MKGVRHSIDPKRSSTQGKSTKHSLVYLLHNIFSALDRGEIYASVFFANFSKDFDLVDHKVILCELETLVVNQLLINWIGSFLSQRSQQVKIARTLSTSVKPHGGIPQGTKLAPLLFTILVNNLASEWPTRVKYMDDTSALELLPHVSPSYLLIIAGNIGRYAAQRGTRFNPKKCKEMVINPLQYTHFLLVPLDIMGTCIERVHSYKILGIILSQDLTWNAHVDYISKKANKWLYAICILKKACVPKTDIVKVYISLIRSILEYAVPAWANIPLYLEDAIESIQKRVLAVIFPGVPYDEALRSAGVTTLTARRDHTCKRFIQNIKTSGFLSNLLPTITEVSHRYTLCSGQIRYDKVLANTSRLNNFVTYKFP